MESLWGKGWDLELSTELYSTSQHGATRRSDGKLVRKGVGLKVQHKTIPPVNTAQHGGQMENLWGKGRGLELTTELSIPPVNTVPHGGWMESLWGKGQGLEFSTELSVPPVDTVLHGGQMENLGEGRGLELSAELTVPKEDGMI